ncbi:2-dehydro-3-deoxyphosphooctonate aldolase [Flavobacterium sp. 316]|uniref:hypothetical protein n=1 Tax=Flavobacterium sp. 316 TaxID=1603293 RepID=UPI0005E8A945|nr:hypothetical protein [Flavobacterium sp. 316]KIX20302.1 2-dehydro-3-deoxyphosphooctonate aldolase [Flavobacterium sp. 316]
MRIFLIFTLTIIFSSCISTKSTIKNVDNTAIKPKISNGAFEITEYALDSQYGYDADYPINIGPLSDRLEELNIKYYFNGLEGPNGEKINYSKTDTCCPFPTDTNNIGAGTLSIYEVQFEESDKKVILYFNIYEKGKIVCPKGFTIKQEQ